MLFKTHWECWKPILTGLIGAGVVSVAALEWMGTSGESTYYTSLIVRKTGAKKKFLPLIPKDDESTTKAIMRILKSVGKCTLVIGIDIAIVVALVLILVKMSYEHERAPSRINMIRDEWGTLLHHAFRGGGTANKGEVKRLLERGANPNIVDGHGLTPLHLAVSHMEYLYNEGQRKDALEIVNLLLRNRANPNIADNYGETPLHTAAEKGLVPVVQLLLQFNADTNLPNNQGEKPFELTTDPKLREMLKPQMKWKTREAIEKRSGS